MHGHTIIEIARNKNLKIGRLLKVNSKGQGICAKSKKEALFIFVKYAPGRISKNLAALVQFYA